MAFLLNQELQRHPEYLRGTVDIYPAMNPLCINTIQRGVPLFDLDMNRMFPGYMQGGTTQRIAGALFDAVKGYRYGFASFYLPGDFVPHVRIMDTGYQTSLLGNLFGLPYVVMRTPKPIDTTPLNYNWHLGVKRIQHLHQGNGAYRRGKRGAGRRCRTAVSEPRRRGEIQLPQRVSLHGYQRERPCHGADPGGRYFTRPARTGAGGGIRRYDWRDP